ncbi:FKBP-type peptidyl-prolyl cis-trans isomerase [Sabulibacter ruber]|uniref:FKBP-type peptidyl-prolyl cis-trans isomerase n=1 Tax=Sabulibacter ruber TaxID=2811901 RepID=UPI002418A24A|nr:FKBP-type peptidyl-prolyl cis-trans isomerase [Sabulibacter ruber]
MQVAFKTVVSLRYLMKNSKGEVLEDTMSGEPIQYIHGFGNILPALEANLIGLRAGDTRNVSICQEDGYQDLDDSFTLELVVEEVRAATKEELEVGLLVQKIKEESCGPEGCC